MRERGSGEASDGGTKFKEISPSVLLLLLLPTQRTVLMLLMCFRVSRLLLHRSTPADPEVADTIDRLLGEREREAEQMLCRRMFERARTLISERKWYIFSCTINASFRHSFNLFASNEKVIQKRQFKPLLW